MKIFISYRRDDSAGYAGRLFDHLSTRFGTRQIFMDIDTIQPGDDFRKAIERAVSTCNVVLVLIGKQWLDATDQNGRRRLEDTGDFVRAEIASALVNPQVRVIPVLVHDAEMPAAHELPDDLKELSWRNAIELSDKRFQYDVNQLMKVIEQGSLRQEKTSKNGQEGNKVTKYWKVAAGLIGLGLIAGLIYYVINNIESVGGGALVGATSSTTMTIAASPATQEKIEAGMTATIEIPPTENSALVPGRVSDLSLRKPTLNEIRDNMLSIWDANLLDVKDIRSPGSLQYDGEARVGTEYLWTFHWCAVDKEILQNNRKNMIVRFYVNGEVVPNDENGPIFAYDYDLTSTNAPCSYWSTVIGGWQQGGSYELIITYTFTEDISDGSTVYLQGDYSHILNVTSK